MLMYGAILLPSKLGRSVPSCETLGQAAKSLPSYPTKSEGGTCEPGQTAKQTGCTPASGEGSPKDAPEGLDGKSSWVKEPKRESEELRGSGKRRWICRLNNDAFEMGKTKEEAMQWCQNSSEGEWGINKKSLNIHDPIKVHLPDLEQNKDWSCGASAMQMVCNYFGVGPENEADYRKLLGTSAKEGTHVARMIAFAKEQGLKVKAQEGLTVADLKEALDGGQPIVVLLQAWGYPEDYPEDGSGHYAIVIGYDDSCIYFEDPWIKGRRAKLRQEEFQERWHDTGSDEKDTGHSFTHWGMICWKPTKVEYLKGLEGYSTKDAAKPPSAEATKPGFTGRQEDKLGRQRCYNDGVLVPCNQIENQQPQQETPGAEMTEEEKAKFNREWEHQAEGNKPTQLGKPPHTTQLAQEQAKVTQLEEQTEEMSDEEKEKFNQEWEKAFEENSEELRANEVAEHDFSPEEAKAEQDWHDQFIQWRLQNAGVLQTAEASKLRRFISGLTNPLLGGAAYLTGLAEKYADKLDTKAEPWVKEKLQAYYERRNPDNEANQPAAELAAGVLGNQGGQKWWDIVLKGGNDYSREKEIQKRGYYDEQDLRAAAARKYEARGGAGKHPEDMTTEEQYDYVWAGSDQRYRPGQELPKSRIKPKKPKGSAGLEKDPTKPSPYTETTEPTPEQRAAAKPVMGKPSKDGNVRQRVEKAKQKAQAKQRRLDKMTNEERQQLAAQAREKLKARRVKQEARSAAFWKREEKRKEKERQQRAKTQGKSYYKDMSWLDSTRGGALVGLPPTRLVKAVEDNVVQEAYGQVRSLLDGANTTTPQLEATLTELGRLSKQQLDSLLVKLNIAGKVSSKSEALRRIRMVVNWKIEQTIKAEYFRKAMELGDKGEAYKLVLKLNRLEVEKPPFWGHTPEGHEYSQAINNVYGFSHTVGERINALRHLLSKLSSWQTKPTDRSGQRTLELTGQYARQALELYERGQKNLEVETKGLLDSAARLLADQWNSLESRYGRKIALGMLAAILATLPIPGNVAAVLAAAEVGRYFRGQPPTAGELGKGLTYATKDKTNGIHTKEASYFATCERDEEGHCLPSGESGKEADKPVESSDQLNLTDEELNAKLQELMGTDLSDLPREKRERIYRANKDNAEAMPQEANPKLNKQERQALQAYGQTLYSALNKPLRSGEEVSESYQDKHEALQSAFAKVQPFASPVTVYRGIDVRNPATSEIVQGLLKAADSEKPITFLGYQSTTLNKEIAETFGENVQLEIVAHQGLDLRGEATNPGEEELLLNHRSRFRVVDVQKTKNQYHFKLEQVLDDGTAEKNLSLGSRFVKESQSYFATCERDEEGHCLPSGESGEDGPSDEEEKPTKETPAPRAKRGTPGSQLKEEVKAKLKALNIQGSWPPADVPLSEIKIADLNQSPENLKYVALMSWEQKTKSGRMSGQYRYTKEFNDRNAAEKHDRVSAIEPHIGKIEQGLVSLMKDSSKSVKEREAAAIANCIRETGLRPTDGDDSIKHGHFGISSLQGRHVKVKGNEVHLDFIGKEGVRNKSILRDPVNVAFIKQAMAQTGPKDFLFKEANSNHAGAVLKRLSQAAGGPEDIMVKDLRTLKAHQLGRQAVQSWQGPPPPLTGNANKDKKLIQGAILQMAAKVSKVLNNEPKQSRDTYVHPEIWRQWQASLAFGI